MRISKATSLIVSISSSALCLVVGLAAYQRAEALYRPTFAPYSAKPAQASKTARTFNAHRDGFPMIVMVNLKQPLIPPIMPGAASASAVTAP